MTTPEFLARIRKMNETFEIPSNSLPTHLGHERLVQFRDILKEEFEELTELVQVSNPATGRGSGNEELTQLADFLGDIIVYACSEARRWGIPIDQVLHVIMDSQDSKLVNGKPIKDEQQKFIKGPNYQPPEPRIAKILDNAVDVDAIVQELLLHVNSVPMADTREPMSSNQEYSPLDATPELVACATPSLAIGPVLEGLRFHGSTDGSRILQDIVRGLSNHLLPRQVQQVDQIYPFQLGEEQPSDVYRVVTWKYQLDIHEAEQRMSGLALHLLSMVKGLVWRMEGVCANLPEPILSEPIQLYAKLEAYQLTLLAWVHFGQGPPDGKS